MAILLIVADGKRGVVMTERFRTLDAMRGVAALAVIAMHSWPLTDDACKAPTCNVSFGYLAVDLFFALSGFVISHSYDKQLRAGMTVREFLIKRAVRLYPVFWLAALVGAMPLAWDVLHRHETVVSLLEIVFLNGLLLPAAVGGHVDPFPLLSPAWSLFFEVFVANLTFAIFWRWLHGATLAAVIVLALVALILSAIHYQSLDVGSLWQTFPGGFARVLFSFYVGVALLRSRNVFRVPNVPAVVVLIILGATFFPRFSYPSSLCYELLCVVALYPALIMVGASALERRPALGVYLGSISYALYVVHIPILLILLRLKERLHMAASVEFAAAFIVVSIAAASLIDTLYDGPARRMLGMRLRPLLEVPLIRRPSP